MLAPVVERLIESRLIERELSRFADEAVDGEVVREQLEGLRAGFTSDDAFAAELERHGLTEAELEAELERQLKVTSYLERRFRALTYVTSDEVRLYFEEDVLPLLREMREPSPEERDQIRRILEERKFNDRVDDWIQGLKERSRIRRYVWVSTQATSRTRPTDQEATDFKKKRGAVSFFLSKARRAAGSRSFRLATRVFERSSHRLETEARAQGHVRDSRHDRGGEIGLVEGRRLLQLAVALRGEHLLDDGEVGGRLVLELVPRVDEGACKAAHGFSMLRVVPQPGQRARDLVDLRRTHVDPRDDVFRKLDETVPGSRRGPAFPSRGYGSGCPRSRRRKGTAG